MNTHSAQLQKIPQNKNKKKNTMKTFQQNTLIGRGEHLPILLYWFPPQRDLSTETNNSLQVSRSPSGWKGGTQQFQNTEHGEWRRK